MTTYKYKYLRQRYVGGGVETECYNTWGESKEVQVFTTAKNKWTYLNFLGLTTSPQRRVYVEKFSWDYNKHADTRRVLWGYYTFNVVKLEPMGYDDYYRDPFDSKRYREEQLLREWRDREKMDEVNPNDFELFRPVVEFCAKHHIKTTRIDAHSGNWLKCPVTGMIYPYDVVFIPDEFG